MSKLTGPQLRALAKYEHIGLTTQAMCGVDTFSALVRLGLLRRSYGTGVIEAEITHAGLATLQQQEPDRG
jgi:hypothetical protein